MNLHDSVAAQAVIAILSFWAFIIPLVGILWAVKWADKGLHGVMKAIQNGAQQAGSRASNIGKKAAMNTKYGQAAQQFMGQRKSISQLKGREALRNTLEKNPSLMKIMGGPGGQKYAARFLDAEQRRNRSEEIGHLKEGLSPSLADAIGKRENIAQSMQRGTWGSGRTITDEDKAAYNKLRTQGYVNSDGSAKNDSRLATASMQSIMGAEIATDDNIRGLSRMLADGTSEDNEQFSTDLRTAASAHGYKNFSTATVNRGVLSKYYNKTGDLEVDPNDPTIPDAKKRNHDQQVAGARKVIQSGLKGVNKDAFDPTMDMSMLDGLEEEYKDAADKDAFVRKIADQTKDDVNKDKVIEALVAKMGGGTITGAGVNATVTITNPQALKDFQDLRASIKSGGAIPPPARFASSTSTPAPGPAPATTPGQPLVVQHNTPRNPTNRPGGNFNGQKPGNPNP